MGPVSIGGDLQGGSGLEAGAIVSFSQIAGVNIGGSLIGGSNTGAGDLYSVGNLGAVKIGGDVRGGSGRLTAYIHCAGTLLTSVSIGGSLIGGLNSYSGLIGANGNLGPVSIGHDLVGVSLRTSDTAAIDRSGMIESFTGRIASVAIGGSIFSGVNASTSGGTLAHDGSINAAKDLGSLTVQGSVVGNGTNAVIISAGGAPKLTSDSAIGSITIGGRVEEARILGGYHPDTLAPADGNAQIGAVSVGLDWIASSLVAGVQNTGDLDHFGDSNDTIIGALASSIAKIASITIGGSAIGTPALADHFGFLSHTIGSFKMRETTFTPPAPLDLVNGDVALAVV
jgi:hypothetical protein